MRHTTCCKCHVCCLQVAETCQLAVRRLEWLQSGGEKQLNDGNMDKNPYCSVDPAPPAVRKSVSELRTILLDESLPLFERYRAMFALRNLGNEEAVLALGEGRIPHYSLMFYLCITVCDHTTAALHLIMFGPFHVDLNLKLGSLCELKYLRSHQSVKLFQCKFGKKTILHVRHAACLSVKQPCDDKSIVWRA